jgi:hypothetical protein
VTSATPPISAGGRVRRGLTTSPLILPRSHQPPNAKNAAIIAPPSAAPAGIDTDPPGDPARSTPATKTPTTSNSATIASLASAVQRMTRAPAPMPR